MATMKKDGKLIQSDTPHFDEGLAKRAAAHPPQDQQEKPVEDDQAINTLTKLGKIMAQPERRADAAVEKAKAELRPQRDMAVKVMGELQPVVQKHARFISYLRSQGFEPEGDGYVKLRRMTTGAAVSYDKIAAFERSVTELMRLDTAAPWRAVREIDNITAEDLKSRPGLRYWRDLAQFVEHLPAEYERHVAQVKSDLAVVFAMLKATGREGLADTWEPKRPREIDVEVYDIKQDVAFCAICGKKPGVCVCA